MKLFLKNSLAIYILSILLLPNAWAAVRVSEDAAAQSLHEDNAIGKGIAKNYDPYPAPKSGYVSDNYGLISKEVEEQIEKLLWQTESISGVEIIVVVIDSIEDYPGSRNESIESFATNLFNTYGIGNLPKNDGVLLLVAKSDRKMRIELGEHYGRTRDYDAKKIIRTTLTPAFKKGEFEEGMYDGTVALIEEFAELDVGFPWHLVWLSLVGAVALVLGLSLIKSGRRGWGYVFVGFGILLILGVIYLILNRRSHQNDTDSSGWSAGGLGGFGGGSSGGGGASGGW